MLPITAYQRLLVVATQAEGMQMEPLLTAEELAEMFRVRVETVHQWRWQGKGPRAIKSGRRFLRYRTSTVARGPGRATGRRRS